MNEGVTVNIMDLTDSKIISQTKDLKEKDHQKYQLSL